MTQMYHVTTHDVRDWCAPAHDAVDMQVFADAAKDQSLVFEILVTVTIDCKMSPSIVRCLYARSGLLHRVVRGASSCRSIKPL